MTKGKAELKDILHARPASNFVRTASAFNSTIEVMCNQKKTDAKSILGVLALGGNTGDTLEISAIGPDELEAVESLVKFVNSGCGDYS